MRVAFAAALAVSLTLPVSAQAVPPDASTWSSNAGAQYAHLLMHGCDRDRATALGQLQHLARQRPDVDLSDAIDPLLDVYAHDASASMRMAAVAALHTIGDTRAMERLAELSLDEEAPNVQRVTRAALKAYLATLPAEDAAALTFHMR